MHRLSDIYFVGGFGTVQWVDVAEYSAIKPDNIVLASSNKTLAALNGQFAERLKRLLSRPGKAVVDDAMLISIDKLGADVRHVHCFEDARKEMQCLLDSDAGKTSRPRSGVRTAL
jgi:hypothetical protein